MEGLFFVGSQNYCSQLTHHAISLELVSKLLSNFARTKTKILAFYLNYLYIILYSQHAGFGVREYLKIMLNTMLLIVHG